ncbi:retrovirus-related pol polyprotein from transposon TNT 1-94 [Tanacetum coccineum]
MKDKVVPNNSQVKNKKTELEDHPRISSISKKTKSVTACNDSLNSQTSNVNVVCATCKKCLADSDHFACVTKFFNDVNARTKKHNVVPVSTRKPNRQANKYVATSPKKTVASESTNQKSNSYYRMLYKRTSKAWKWWIEHQCPSRFKLVPNTKMIWVPKDRNENVQKKVSFAIDNIIQLILFIVDSGCTKHTTGNPKLLCNFVEKYLGTVHFRNDQFSPILGYGDLVQGNIMINRVYYVEGLNNNLFSLWHRRLSHLNFDYINLLSKKDIMIGLPKLKYVKDQVCSSCEVSKAKRSSFKTKVVPSSKGRLNLLHIDLCGPIWVESINGKKYILAEAIATACYTQNRSIIITTHEKTAYHIINDRKPYIRHLHIFGCTCYLTRDGEHLDKMKEKGDPYILASDYNNSGPAPQIQNVSSSVDTTALLQQELDLLFGPFYDEFFSAEVVESSSHNIDNSNMHTYYQPHDSEYRWTKDHPLEQVRGNPSKPMQTRRQLATNHEMCMFALTVSTAEPKNIKEAKVDSAWIEAMQEELH